MRVYEIMNKAVVVEGGMSLKKAAQVMSSRNIGSLIVLNKNKVVGIVTERDILKNVGKMSGKVSSIMSKSVITVDEDESIDNAALIMAEHKIKRLPVLSGGKLVGVVSATDVLANSDALNESFLFD